MADSSLDEDSNEKRDLNETRSETTVVVVVVAVAAVGDREVGSLQIVVGIVVDIDDIEQRRRGLASEGIA